MWVQEGGWKVAQATKEAHQLQQQGAGPKAWAEGGSKSPSGMEEEGERTIGVTGEIVTPGMSRAVLGADFLKNLAEMGAGLLETCL